MPAAKRCSAHSKLSACMGNALPHGARPRTKLSTGCSGTTEPDCTRRWPTSVRCGSKKTGWPGSPARQVRSPAMGYGIQGQGQIPLWRTLFYRGKWRYKKLISPDFSVCTCICTYFAFAGHGRPWTAKDGKL